MTLTRYCARCGFKLPTFETEPCPACNQSTVVDFSITLKHVYLHSPTRGNCQVCDQKDSHPIHQVDDGYPDDLVRRAKMMNVHPERLMPHDGPGECPICGCEPGDRHDLATHEANADLTGG